MQMVQKKEKIPMMKNLGLCQKQRLTDNQNVQTELPRIHFRSVGRSSQHSSARQKKNSQDGNVPIKFLKKNIDMRRVRLSMNPLRSLEKDIKSNLSCFNGHKSSAPTLMSGVMPSQISQTEEIPRERQAASILRLSHRQSETEKVQIRLGRGKINLIIKVQLCSKISWNTEAQGNLSRMYYLEAVSGLAGSRSGNLTLQRLADSQITLKMNERLLKKSIGLSFYQVSIPEALGQRKKIGNFTLPLPLQRIKQSDDILMTTVVRLWENSHRELQNLKLFVRIEKV